jgi:hypothetical protein
MMENEQHNPSVLDFVERMVGPMLPHRREWRILSGAGGQLLELANLSRQGGDTFLDFIL